MFTRAKKRKVKSLPVAVFRSSSPLAFSSANAALATGPAKLYTIEKHNNYKLCSSYLLLRF